MTSRSSQYMHQRVWNDQPHLTFLPAGLLRPGDRVYRSVAGEMRLVGTVLAVQLLGGGLVHISFAERTPVTANHYVSHWVLRPA